jgi:hypothetical protein
MPTYKAHKSTTRKAVKIAVADLRAERVAKAEAQRDDPAAMRAAIKDMSFGEAVTHLLKQPG